jgi:hypothetical protein
MRQSVVLLVCIWYSFSFCSNCFATLMGYSFTASLSSALTPAYGVTVPMGSQVHGQFVLDSQVVGVIPPGFPNVTTYRHLIPEGFKATFGSLDMRADDYIVSVSNNVLQPGGFLADIISIRWASNLTPSLAPIHVNGATKTTGMFVINLVGSQNLFSNTSLPATLNISSFVSKLSFLADTTDGTLDLIYNVNSLAPVEVQLELPVIPEPNSFFSVLVLFLMGHLLFAGRLASPSSVMHL